MVLKKLRVKKVKVEQIVRLNYTIIKERKVLQRN